MVVKIKNRYLINHLRHLGTSKLLNLLTGCAQIYHLRNISSHTFNVL